MTSRRQEHCRRLARNAFALLSLVSVAAWAAEPAKPFAAPQAADPVSTTGAGSLAQVTLSLVLVLAAVFAAAWVVRRLRGMGRFGGGAIEIVAEIGLGAKERAVLVQVGKQQLLLGVTAQQVNTLHVLNENVAAPHGLKSDLRSATAQESASGAFAGDHSLPSGEGRLQRPDFRSILKRSLGL